MLVEGNHNNNKVLKQGLEMAINNFCGTVTNYIVTTKVAPYLLTFSLKHVILYIHHFYQNTIVNSVC